jgi:hypothetical protein
MMVVINEPRKALQNQGCARVKPTCHTLPIQPVKAKSRVLMTRVNNPSVRMINRQVKALKGGRRIAFTRPKIKASQMMLTQLPCRIMYFGQRMMATYSATVLIAQRRINFIGTS